MIEAIEYDPNEYVQIEINAIRPAEHIGINFTTTTLGNAWDDGEWWFNRQFLLRDKVFYFVRPSEVCQCCGTTLKTKLIRTRYHGSVYCHHIMGDKLLTYELDLNHGKLIRWAYQLEFRSAPYRLIQSFESTPKIEE